MSPDDTPPRSGGPDDLRDSPAAPDPYAERPATRERMGLIPTPT